MTQEKLYDVYWQGPWKVDTASWKPPPELNDNHVLYQVYGRHPVYGSNRLLYLGKTTRGPQRLIEHMSWIDDEVDECFIRAASIGLWGEPEKWDWGEWYGDDQEDGTYPRLEDDDLLLIESLLILANQPVYNSSSKNHVSGAKHIRVFNTGRRGDLLPEVSGLFFSER